VFVDLFDIVEAAGQIMAAPDTVSPAIKVLLKFANNSRMWA
jgi:hypothetical protein